MWISNQRKREKEKDARLSLYIEARLGNSDAVQYDAMDGMGCYSRKGIGWALTVLRYSGAEYCKTNQTHRDVVICFRIVL